MSNPSIVQLEHQIESKKKQVAMNNALERLFKNKDFQKVVIDGYMKDEAIRLVSTKGAKMNQSPNIQEEILRDIDGIGCFQRFLAVIQLTGEAAAASLEEDQEVLDEMHAEELEKKGGE